MRGLTTTRAILTRARSSHIQFQLLTPTLWLLVQILETLCRSGFDGDFCCFCFIGIGWVFAKLSSFVVLLCFSVLVHHVCDCFWMAFSPLGLTGRSSTSVCFYF